MKKKITVYFNPVSLELELNEDLDRREIEEEINRQVYDIKTDEITREAEIDYWEEK